MLVTASITVSFTLLDVVTLKKILITAVRTLLMRDFPTSEGLLRDVKWLQCIEHITLLQTSCAAGPTILLYFSQNMFALITLAVTHILLSLQRTCRSLP